MLLGLTKLPDLSIAMRYKLDELICKSVTISKSYYIIEITSSNSVGMLKSCVLLMFVIEAPREIFWRGSRMRLSLGILPQDAAFDP